MSWFGGLFHAVSHAFHRAFRRVSSFVHRAFHRVRKAVSHFVGSFHRHVRRVSHHMKRAYHRVSNWVHHAWHHARKAYHHIRHSIGKAVHSAWHRVRHWYHSFHRHASHPAHTIHRMVHGVPSFVRKHPWVVPAVLIPVAAIPTVVTYIAPNTPTQPHVSNVPATNYPGTYAHAMPSTASSADSPFNPVSGDKDGFWKVLMGLAMGIGSAGLVYLWNKHSYVGISTAYAATEQDVVNQKQEQPELNLDLDPYHWYLRGRGVLSDARKKLTNDFPEWRMKIMKKNAEELLKTHSEMKPVVDISLKIDEIDTEAKVGVGEFVLDIADLVYTAMWSSPISPFGTYILQKNAIVTSSSIEQVFQNPELIKKAIDDQIEYVKEHPIREGVHYAAWILLTIITAGAGAEAEGAEAGTELEDTLAGTVERETTNEMTGLSRTAAGTEVAGDDMAGVEGSEALAGTEIGGGAKAEIASYIDPKGREVKLYVGTETKGFTHIKLRHGEDFRKAFGISEDDIPTVLDDAFKKGKIINEFTKNGKPTAILESTYQDKKVRVIYNYVTGEIITAHPMD